MRGEGESRENYWTMYGGGHELSKLTHYSDHGSPVRQQDFSGSFHFSHIQVSGSCTVGTQEFVVQPPRMMMNVRLSPITSDYTLLPSTCLPSPSQILASAPGISCWTLRSLILREAEHLPPVLYQDFLCPAVQTNKETQTDTNWRSKTDERTQAEGSKQDTNPRVKHTN